LFSLIFKIIITNLLFSVSICSLLMRFNEDRRHSNTELLLYSLGVGPAFTTLLLYYSLLIIPHQSNLFYLLFVLFIYLLLALGGAKSFKPLYYNIRQSFKDLFCSINKSMYARIEFAFFISIIIILLTGYFYIYLTRLLPQPLAGHDILGYATMGRILFEEKSLGPVWNERFAESGFLYFTSHAPSFPLLLTWEKFLNSFFCTSSDLYLRSVSTYYGLLILGVQFYWTAKKSRWLGLLAAFALMSGLGFSIGFLFKHLDTYRIFFLIMSWIYLAYTIKEKDFLSVLLFGIFSGFAAFCHRIGMILVGFNCFALFLFIDASLKKRLLKTCFVIMVLLLFGGAHYILDTFWGKGWLFETIKLCLSLLGIN